MKKLIPPVLFSFFAVCLYGQHSARFDNKANKIALRGDYEMAIKLFSEAIRLDRFFHEAYYNRAIAKSKLKDYEGAILDYSKAIEQVRNLPVHIITGVQTRMSWAIMQTLLMITQKL